jgi:hypothetical protein
MHLIICTNVHMYAGDVVLDIGANVGFFSIFAELQFGLYTCMYVCVYVCICIRYSCPIGDCCNALQIIAVEPLGRNFDKLVKNLKK